MGRDTRSSIEILEQRTLLSLSTVMHPDLIVTPSSAQGPAIQGITPSQIRQAYGFDQVSFDNGAVAADGSGQTIAIVDAFDDPSIVSDLNVFDTQFGLNPPPSLKIVNQTGGSSLPVANPDWDSEIAMDVEWSHAIAPGANILLVEANTDNTSDLMTAVKYARRAPGVSVVSLSWGGSEIFSINDSESPGQLQYDPDFTTPAGHQGVTFVAAAGDTGAREGVDWPASSPNILSVGGTTLTLADDSGTYGSETGWNGTSGGISQIEAEPSYQLGVQITGKRSSPDVAYNADPNTGFAEYDSVLDDGDVGWQVIGGTSAGTPQWSAFIAIADQGRALSGQSTLDGATQTLPLLYSLYSAPGTAGYSNYTSDFNDIVGNGTNHHRSTSQAAAGYDTVTGLGSPRVENLLPFLTGASPTPFSQTASPITAVFLEPPSSSAIAGTAGVLKLRLINTIQTQFSGPVSITLSASPNGSLAGATAITTFPIANLSLRGAGVKQQPLKFVYPDTLADSSEFLIVTVSATSTDTTPAQTTAANATAILAPTVDLAASFKQTEPLVIKAGRTVTIAVVVQNLGNVPADGTLSLMVYVGGQDLSLDANVANIINRKIAMPSGRRLTLQVHFKSPAEPASGPYDVLASITSSTEPADDDLSNDLATIGTVNL